MFNYKKFALGKIAGLGTRYMPFADVATKDLPLSRLLRLSLFQVTVGMALVLLVGTLNRVMIVELGVPATLVSVMLALPLLFAPLRAFIGFKSDNHASALGWRRTPCQPPDAGGWPALARHTARRSSCGSRIHRCARSCMSCSANC